MGGRSETWVDFGTWWAKVTAVSFVQGDTPASLTYRLEGPYRSDLAEYFHGTRLPEGVTASGGLAIRAVVNGQTLKVFLVENPQFRNRTLIAHCALAEHTQ